MSDSNEFSDLTKLFTTFGVLLLIVMLIGAWPFYVYNREFRRCVQLENGLNLGYNAVFDLRDPYLLPYGVPKLPDGTPLFDQPSWSVFVTDTTVYGRTFGKHEEAAFNYAWRSDTGLVRSAQDTDVYEKLISEAGPANSGLGAGSYGPVIVMREFMKRPEYANQRCATRLFAW